MHKQSFIKTPHFEKEDLKRVEGREGHAGNDFVESDILDKIEHIGTQTPNKP